MEEFTITHSDMAITLSIIVPVYNVRRYLRRCVDSLLCQDIEKDQYEIILVDDGSTDGGEDLCDVLAISESNVVVVHQVNQGLSSARNTGLEIAKGKYILFVDSDDWIEKMVLKGLIQRMGDGDLDILRFGFRRVVERDGIEKIDSEERREETVSTWTGPYYLINKLGFQCYAWQFLIKRSVLIDNCLLFRPGIIFEDTEWTPRLLEKAQRVSESGAQVYNYRQREGSITSGSKQKVVNGQIILIDLLKAQMDNWENKFWHKGMIAHIVLSMITLISTHLYSQRKSLLKELQMKHVFPLAFYMANRKARRKIRLINFSPSFACFIIHTINK